MVLKQLISLKKILQDQENCSADLVYCSAYPYQPQVIKEQDDQFSTPYITRFIELALRPFKNTRALLS